MTILIFGIILLLLCLKKTSVTTYVYVPRFSSVHFLTCCELVYMYFWMISQCCSVFVTFIHVVTCSLWVLVHSFSSLPDILPYDYHSSSNPCWWTLGWFPVWGFFEHYPSELSCIWQVIKSVSFPGIYSREQNRRIVISLDNADLCRRSWYSLYS